MKKYSFIYFLLIVPLFCKATTMDISMPSHIAINDQLEVSCTFRSETETFRITLLHGDSKTVASYMIADSAYKILPNNKFTLKVKPGTTIKEGTLTFIISPLACRDFTWYMCQTEHNSGRLISSQNRTLKVKPKIDSIDTTSVPTVHQMSTFTCRGSISKEGYFIVKWYRKFFSRDYLLLIQPAKVISENECRRRVESSLTYNVSENDIPALKLGCQIYGGQYDDLMQNFTVQGITCKPKNQSIPIGSNVTICCQVLDNSPTILIKGKFAILNGYQKFNWNSDQEERYEILGPGKIRINNVKMSDDAGYGCSTSDENILFYIAVLHVSTRPDEPVSTRPASSSTDHRIIIIWVFAAIIIILISIIIGGIFIVRRRLLTQKAQSNNRPTDNIRSPGGHEAGNPHPFAQRPGGGQIAQSIYDEIKDASNISGHEDRNEPPYLTMTEPPGKKTAYENQIFYENVPNSSTKTVHLEYEVLD